jgi:hypothetical protein
MSELVARLRRRAHLPEFKICGDAADALEAAEQDRDAANRRYEQIWNERQCELQESRKAARMIGSWRQRTRNALAVRRPE